MKNKALSIALVLAAPLLTQCVIVDDQGNASGQSPAVNAASDSMSSNQVYDLGLEKGFADGRGGLSRNPHRHNGTFPPPEAIHFNRGYEIGYNKGIR